MVMTANTLATELKKIGNELTEPPVRAGWASAYTKYMRQSTVLGISPASDAVLAGANGAMDSTLSGITTPQTSPNAAAQKIVAAVNAFWVAALAAGVTVWVTAPPLVPTPITLPTTYLSPSSEAAAIANLAAVFTSNTQNSKSKSDCYDAIAAAIHPIGAGATVTQATVPTPTPGIPVT